MSALDIINEVVNQRPDETLYALLDKYEVFDILEIMVEQDDTALIEIDRFITKYGNKESNVTMDDLDEFDYRKTDRYERRKEFERSAL